MIFLPIILIPSFLLHFFHFRSDFCSVPRAWSPRLETPCDLSWQVADGATMNFNEINWRLGRGPGGSSTTGRRVVMTGWWLEPDWNQTGTRLEPLGSPWNVVTFHIFYGNVIRYIMGITKMECWNKMECHHPTKNHPNWLSLHHFSEGYLLVD